MTDRVATGRVNLRLAVIGARQGLLTPPPTPTHTPTGRVDLQVEVTGRATVTGAVDRPRSDTWTLDQSRSGARAYTGVGLVDYDPPVADPPDDLVIEPIQELHIDLPDPVLVDGRPT